MKKLLNVLVFSFLVSLAGTAMAHGDHDVISETSAAYIASNTVKKMTFKDMGYHVGLLDESWKVITTDDVNVVEVGDGYYLMSVSNQKTRKQVFLKINGSGQVLDVFGNNSF